MVVCRNSQAGEYEGEGLHVCVWGGGGGRGCRLRIIIPNGSQMGAVNDVRRTPRPKWEPDAGRVPLNSAAKRLTCTAPSLNHRQQLGGRGPPKTTPARAASYPHCTPSCATPMSVYPITQRPRTSTDPSFVLFAVQMSRMQGTDR